MLPEKLGYVIYNISMAG